MELRFVAVLTLFACALVTARPNAEHRLTRKELESDNLQQEVRRDELEGSGQEEPLNEKKPMNAQFFEKPDFATPPRTDRRKRQFGMGMDPFGYSYGGIGSFYKYNPYTMSTSTGWYNPYGGAIAVSGFGPFGVPYAFNQAYLLGR